MPNPRISRRQFHSSLIAAIPAAAMTGRMTELRAAGQAVTRSIAAGPFQPNWDSLTRGYQCPDWYRDAKFGIWAHWTAQCVPEQGDWYARQMYIQGHPQYNHHLNTYGHPTRSGFMELDNRWKADKWEPAPGLNRSLSAACRGRGSTLTRVAQAFQESTRRADRA